jgi:hypothetical protein
VSFPKSRLASGLTVEARGRIGVTLSVSTGVAPTSFRVVDGRHVLSPGPITFRGNGGHSFTFTSKGSRGFGCHEIRIEWQAAGDGKATATGYDLSIVSTGPTTPRAACA